ncbi:patatin-domain-containing protein [Melanogaster broomeanus]|nr:patatin-domain-containing protein [Melanogaster broomeanus]
MKRTTPPDGFSVDYIDESHINAFKTALQLDERDHLGAVSPSTHPSTPIPQSPRVRKVSALSDFAPINLKVKRRRKGERSPDHKQDWLFLLVRWPLLFFIFTIIAAQFGLYIFIRQVVNTKEWLSAWRGRKGELRRRLRAARTYEEWKEAALILDRYLDFHEWKQVDEDPFYDWKLVDKVNRSLRILREKNDVRGVLGVLETCIRTNFAGTFLGTKNLIESYHDEQEKALQFIRDSTELSNEEKKRFFKSASTNLGTLALCLSGGASFGYYHTGVVKAFLDAGLLPRVIAGTSAGGLIAALVCTRTDEELKDLLVPELADKITACEDPFEIWMKRFWKTGARFDSVTWARKCAFFTRGSMTFREAYLRTGRILNISVIPADRHSPTKLLNYVTAPDTVIWSALIASAAVPGILNPVVLMQKLKDGRVVPWNWGSKFKDGSLRVDIPIQALNLYFNVTHPVVSQVNPHVHLFFFAPRGSAGKPVAHRKGKGWRGNFLLSAAEQWLKLELTKNFKVIRDLELLPQLLGQDWSSVFLQRFDGAVTIWPKTRLLVCAFGIGLRFDAEWLHRTGFRILSDPDPAELERMIRVGEMVTWPKLHMIENRYRIEKQILFGRQAVRRLCNVYDPIGLPEPITGTRLPVVPTKSAFVKNGTTWYFRRGRPPLHDGPDSGASTPYDAGYTNCYRSPSALLFCSRGSRNEDRSTTPDPPPILSPAPRRGNNSSRSTFFNNLRRRSLTALTIPFSGSPRSTGTTAGNEASRDGIEPGWSSDSSSEEDIAFDDSGLAGGVDFGGGTQVDSGGGGGPGADVDSD